MSLATILLPFIVYFATPPLPAHLLSLVPQSSQMADAGQDAGTNPQAQTPAGSQAQTPAAGNQKPAKFRRRKHTKKAAASTQVECPPANPASGAAPTNAASAGTSPNAAAPSPAQSNQATSNQSPSSQSPSTQFPSNQAPSNQAPSNPAPSNNAPSNAATAKATPSGDASPPPNCPPSKTVVHDGGTTEPTIQLIGGKGDEQAAQQRSTTDQLLGSTEDNLKKIAGRQLNSTQQEMVNQIQQFVEQSRAAVSAGDLARGHNLALKAHLLSDELVKP